MKVLNLEGVLFVHLFILSRFRLLHLLEWPLLKGELGGICGVAVRFVERGFVVS
jgi:hypothetical protein